MILYHFTFLKTDDQRGGFMRRLDGSPIWFPGDTRLSDDDNGDMELMPAPEGLTPEPGNGTGWGSCNIPGAPEVVWLTRNPRTVFDKDSHIFRITLKIPSTDRRLINWPKWRDRNIPWSVAELPPSLLQIAQDWWGYAGTIPLSRIVDIELLRDQKTPWYGGDEELEQLWQPRYSTKRDTRDDHGGGC